MSSHAAWFTQIDLSLFLLAIELIDTHSPSILINNSFFTSYLDPILCFYLFGL